MQEKSILIQSTAQQFEQLDSEAQKFVLGYITGKQDERATWEQKQEKKKPA